MAKKIFTTHQGVPVSDNQHSLNAGQKGQVLSHDVHLREKLVHYDTEQISKKKVEHAQVSGSRG